MLSAVRPSPIIPSCMAGSFLTVLDELVGFSQPRLVISSLT